MVPKGKKKKTGKPGKCEGKSQGILSRLEKSGNFTQNTGKMRKILYWKTEKNTAKVSQ